jgi:hypothetical protein
MFADRRRLVIAGIAVLLLAVGGWWQTRMAPPTNAATVAPARTPRASRTKAEPVAAAVKPLRLDVLTAERVEPSGTARNPFRFQPKVVAPPPPVPQPPADLARPITPPVPAGPPPAPPIPLKFIALVERANGVKWAVLSDGKATMYGRDGDTIDGRYRIVKIGAESVEVTHLDGRGRQVIRLTGQ